MGVDSSGDFSIVGVVVGGLEKLRFLHGRLGRGRVHMRELNKAERRRVSGVLLSLLRDGFGGVEAICFYTGFSVVRGVLRREKPYVPSIKVEEALMKALTLIILEEALKRGVKEVRVDRELYTAYLRARFVRVERSFVVELADVVSWSNLRRRRDLEVRFKGAVREVDVKDRVLNLAKSFIK